jgi:hypothetical protein
MPLALASLLLVAAAVARPFPEERELLDRRLETLRRILPDGPTPGSDVAVVTEIAKAAHLGNFEAAPRPPVESGNRGEVVLDVSAVARFADAERFFRQAALHHRLIDVETMTLTATPEDVVRMTAVLRFPFRPVKAPLSPAPDGARARLVGVPRPMADAYVRDQALAVSKSEQIAQVRRSRRNPRLFLSEVASAVRERPVVLNFASAGEEFVVRGLAVGEGPVRALETRFERGFFRVAEFLVARQGSCHRFEVRGRTPVVGTDAEIPLPSEDPFRQDDTPCRVDRDTSAVVPLRPLAPKSPPKGALSLRLRDVDLADVFLVLHQITSQAFLVDGDIAGRVTVDLNRVSAEEVQSTLEKSGLRFVDQGRVRRVARVRSDARPPVTAAGGASTAPPASFTLKRAEVRDLLAVMSEADPALAVLGPQGSLGRVSLWARDVPLMDLRAAALDSAALSERTEEGRRILERNPGSGEPVFPVAGTAPDRRLVLRPADLSLHEFELAGLASAGETWIAFSYSPTGALNAYRPGDRLADAVVKSVESTDVLLDTEEGLLRVPLAPLPR